MTEDDGYIRLSRRALGQIRLVHLVSGLDPEADSTAAGAVPTDISGYTEWATTSVPAVSIVMCRPAARSAVAGEEQSAERDERQQADASFWDQDGARLAQALTAAGLVFGIRIDWGLPTGPSIIERTTSTSTSPLSWRHIVISVGAANALVAIARSDRAKGKAIVLLRMNVS